MVIREDLGGDELGKLSNWPNQHFHGAIQRMADANGAAGVVRILNEVLAHRNREISTVAAQGVDMIRLIGGPSDDFGRMGNPNRRFNFRNAVWGPRINTWATKLK